MYSLELERVVAQIKKKKARTVCIQLPEGLKRQAIRICDYIEEHTQAVPIIWGGSCFGACDTPSIDNVDLLVQWGHSEWD